MNPRTALKGALSSALLFWNYYSYTFGNHFDPRRYYLAAGEWHAGEANGEASNAKQFCYGERLEM